MDEDPFIKLFNREFQEVMIFTLDSLEERMTQVEARLDRLEKKLDWVTDKVI